MKIEILLFAGLREIEGTDQIAIEAPSGIKFADLRLLISGQHPRLRYLLEASRFAAGNCMVGEEQLVDAADRIAIIPPVSGG
jgi:MoaE-MoaD fusion protein